MTPKDAAAPRRTSPYYTPAAHYAITPVTPFNIMRHLRHRAIIYVYHCLRHHAMRDVMPHAESAVTCLRRCRYYAAPLYYLHY